MASTFRPVNSPMAIRVENHDGRARSPTPPTPTKVGLAQRPLPSSPFPQAVQIPESIEEVKATQRRNSQHSRAPGGDSEDVDMDDTDGEAHGSVGSDTESVNGDGSKSNKKKKSQRFYCTDYPPCNLSFTRSEHLARHIRKHTGERPFQCHCARRFSRLDNLRQHAQTVHVNEDIPNDSLAATGTRYQRQIRTERVRGPGRARAATAGTIGPSARGHAKSLSTSSIGSVGSNFSTREDIRRHPPVPLVMTDHRLQYPSEQYPPRVPSPSDFSTPTSATFTPTQNSPRWGTVLSPASPHSRSHSWYIESQIPARRLSVPSNEMPFQFYGSSPGRPTFPPGSSDITSGAHQASYSPATSSLASPTTSIFSFNRRESTSATDDWRRRTWHPDSNNLHANPPGSRLSHVLTPSQCPSPLQNHVQSPVQQQQPNSPIRLPSIQFLCNLPHRPPSPSRKNASPMIVESDSSHPPTLLPTPNVAEPEERRNNTDWAMGLHRGLTRLEIASTPKIHDNAGTWARDTTRAVAAQADRVRLHQPTVRFDESVMAEAPPKSRSPRGFHHYTQSAPSIASSRDSKRRGWHHIGTSPYGETPPEKMARVDRMVHPNMSEFSSFPAREIPSGPIPREQNPGERGMVRLETLVAVATGEGNATKAY
ncbi:hypothetical protein F5Y03DRAFT_34553 [Xylaria venustula]|nr:hypothetical protein F5Y03DRAFT_34553 [Xylaria venustula]